MTETTETIAEVKGVDWLGAWLDETGVIGIDPRTLANHREQGRRFYEQLRLWPKRRANVRVLQYRTRWKIWLTASVAALALQATPCGAAIMVYSSNVTLSPAQTCVPVSLLLNGGGETSISGTESKGTGMRVMLSGSATWPTDAAHAGVTTSISSGSGSWPGVGVLAGCPGVTGLLSNDGHMALVFQPANGPGTETVGVQNNTPGQSTDGWLSPRFEGWTIRTISFYVSACGASSERIAWPSFFGPSPASCNIPTSLRFSTQDKGGTIAIVWDGVYPPTGTRYDLPAGLFAAGVTQSLLSPEVAVSVVPPEPTCSTTLSSGGAVGLTPDSPPSSCAAGGCTKINQAGLGQTNIEVHCALPSGLGVDQTKIVKPRYTFQGPRAAGVGDYLLQTSQSGVFIWGATSGTNGCGLWGATGAQQYGSVPFDGATRWTGGWGDTSSGWVGSNWTGRAQINWGVCLDTTAGSGRTIHAGPFTATATWMLHLD